jgi:hypothetical protein
MKSRLAARVKSWLVAHFVAILGLVSCQAVLGGEGTFLCKDNAGCPNGRACAIATGTCVAPCDPSACAAEGGGCNPNTQACDPGVAMDADVPDAGPMETGPQKPYPLGIACDTSADCASAFCADGRYLAATTFGKVGSICSKPCCTSAECGTGLVCQSSGKGARYCVPAEALGRGAQGVKSGGDACTENAQCTSGLCKATRCVDTCCNAIQCKAGSECRFDAVDSVRGWHCLIAPGGATGATQTTCAADTTCKSNYCNTVCRTACCSDAQCGAAGLAYCRYEYQARTSEQPMFCLGSGATGGMPGQACTSDPDCLSTFCENMRCAQPCCLDSDCSGAKKCRPDPARQLPRCVVP